MHPSCFGSPVSICATSVSCRACPSARSCVVEAARLIEQLPDTPLTRRERLALNVTAQALTGSPAGAGEGSTTRTVVASTRGVRRISLSPEELARLGKLPARVATQVRKLLELGWFSYAKREMACGRNPASKGWRKVLCGALLTGGITRACLQLALIEQLDLGAPSARVQASLAVAVFSAGGLVRELQGTLLLSQN